MVNASASGYASLTGTGETTTPGDLLQTGSLGIGKYYNGSADWALEVDDATNDNTGIQFELLGGFWCYDNGSGISLEEQGNAPFEIYASGTGGIDIESTGSGTYGVQIWSNAGVQIQTLATGTLGFFNKAPVIQQVSGGTLAGVIAGLVALGLFSS